MTTRGPTRRRLRIVLWDVYDTLVVGRAAEPMEIGRPGGAAAVCAALEAVGVERIIEGAAEAIDRLIVSLAGAWKAAKLHAGIQWPEPDVRTLWRSALATARRRGWVRRPGRPPDIERIAAIYEALTNPARPMPDAHAMLRHLRDAGVQQGIVSNAQFFTPPLLDAMFPNPDGPFWRPDLCVWSWVEGVAKPSPALYANAAARVRRLGVDPCETLMIGNHPDNDVSAAARAGFRTAWLCAADALARVPRSLWAQGRAADLRLRRLGDLPAALRRAGFRLG